MKLVAIHGVPRSGTSWLGSILDSSPDTKYLLQPLFSYAFKDFLNANSSPDKIEDFIQGLSVSEDEFINQYDKKKLGTYPIFEKNSPLGVIVYKEARYHYIIENLLKRNPEIKVVGIIRNPHAVIHSFFRAPREFRRDLGWKELEEWRFAEKKNEGRKENFYGYQKWVEVATMFLDLQNRFPNRFYIQKYEDLIDDIENEISKLFSFCELTIHPQTLNFLASSMAQQSDGAYGVYKQNPTINAWQGLLHDNIVNEIKNDADYIRLNNIFHWD